MRHVYLHLLVFLVLSSQGLAALAADRPLYYDREVTQADLRGRTLRELTLLRNTIFARAGHGFRKKWLSDYFSAQPWYHPTAKDDDSKITATDRKNAQTIATYEESLDRAEFLRRRDAILAEQKAGRTSPESDIELRLLSIKLGEWTASQTAPVPVEDRSPLEDPGLLDKLLTVKQLSNLSRRDLRILRNTIYARRGRPFKSDVLTSYFADMAWYHPDQSYEDARLSAVDKRNIKMVRSVEDSLGGPLSEHDHKQEDGWLFQA